jgi:hypothetical protein
VSELGVKVIAMKWRGRDLWIETDDGMIHVLQGAELSGIEMSIGGVPVPPMGDRLPPRSDLERVREDFVTKAGFAVEQLKVELLPTLPSDAVVIAPPFPVHESYRVDGDLVIFSWNHEEVRRWREQAVILRGVSW